MTHRRSLPLRSAAAVAVVAAMAFVGCSGQPERFPTRRVRPVAVANAGDDALAPATRRSDLQTFTKFSVYATPPAGWKQKVNDGDPRAEHVTWTGPSGNTAFGVVFFRLPWPVGHELAFRYGFLAEARKREGSAEVLEKRWDPEIEGLRFTVRTPRFTAETKFFVRGTRGWAAYSGTKTTQPVDEAELALARVAREDADFGEELPEQRSAADGRR